ncbi:serine threonine-protein kinase [Nesidiocoris tenuis]|uniref:Serine threonine-protein kinase n=2 Tax=Nesidiocoris tenuis TaxID=355587 RepID=A0ABN7BAS4_9HEMI|nr:serine threonine-protein kinase [Nesidiocoris tenuis]
MEEGPRHENGLEGADEYFTSYEDLDIHRIMLTDKRRNEAYRRAIESNRDRIEGKTVLDVGAGTGFLSILCAKAGARKVFAVEASSGMIPLLRESCRANDVENVVAVVEGNVETVDLPEERVDVIVSEWMGFHLLHEGMLSSVIKARDRFLRDGGTMVPDVGRIRACLCKVPSLFEFWDDVDGVNLSHVGTAYRTKFQTEPAILALESDDRLTPYVTLVEFDLKRVQDAELAEISKEIVSVPKEACLAQGLCLSFEVELFGVVFSTGPDHPETHWKQSVLVFPSPLDMEAGEAAELKVTLARTENPRRYAIQLSILEENEIEHPLGCECMLPRCRIINAYMQNSDQIEEGAEIIDIT